MIFFPLVSQTRSSPSGVYLPLIGEDPGPREIFFLLYARKRSASKKSFLQLRIFSSKRWWLGWIIEIEKEGKLVYQAAKAAFLLAIASEVSGSREKLFYSLVNRDTSRTSFLCWLFFLAAAVVEGFVDFFQVLIGHMGIDLRRRDRGVAEHRLHTPDVGAVDEEIGGKAVAERMRVDVFDDAGFGGVVLDEPLDTARSEAERLALGVPLVDEALLGERDEQRGIGISPAIEVAGEGAFGGG